MCVCNEEHSYDRESEAYLIKMRKIFVAGESVDEHLLALVGWNDNLKLKLFRHSLQAILHVHDVHRELLRSHVSAQGLSEGDASSARAAPDRSEPQRGPLERGVRGQPGIEGRVRGQEEGVEAPVPPFIDVLGKVPAKGDGRRPGLLGRLRIGQKLQWVLHHSSLSVGIGIVSALIWAVTKIARVKQFS